MKFLSAKTTWTNLELIPFKLCVASAYVLVGAYFHSFFAANKIIVIGLFAVSTVYTLYLWVVKMKKEN
jgi:hypothetical protein